jgi:hypothetical protein
LSKSHKSIASRLLDAAQQLNQVVHAQQARSVFNDIQQLLGTRNDSVEDKSGYKWRPELETSLVQIMNLMNLQSKLMVGSDSNCESLQISCAAKHELRSVLDLSPINMVNFCWRELNRLKRRDATLATWYTQHGRLELLFWTTGILSAVENGTGKMNQSASTSFAKIAF